MIATLLEIGRLVKRPLSLVLLVVVLLIGATAPIAQSRLPSNPGAPQMAVSISYSGGYVIGVYAFQDSGSRLAGAQLSLVAQAVGSGTGGVVSTSGTTGPSGYGRLVMDVPDSDYSATLSLTWAGQVTIDSFLLNASIGSGPGAGPGVLSVVAPGEFVATPTLQVSFYDGNGSVPVGLSASYEITPINQNDPGLAEPPIGGSLGIVRSAPQWFTIPIPPGVDSRSTVVVNLTWASGRIALSGVFYLGQFLQSNGSPTPAGRAAVAGVETLSLFAPLAAAFVAYRAYGRDRLSGTLEPVLALPTTRLGVLTRRFVGAAAVAALIASAGELALATSLGTSFGLSIPVGLWGAFIAMGLIDTLAVVGLVFLASHLLRSSGSLLVGSVVFVLATSILWGALVVIAAIAAGVPPDVYTSAAWMSQVNLLNPLSLGAATVISAIQSASPPGALPLISGQANSWGLAIAALLWVTIPLGLAAVLATKRD